MYKLQARPKNGFALIMILLLVLVISGIAMILTQRFLFAFKFEFLAKSKSQALNYFNYYEIRLNQSLEQVLRESNLLASFDLKEELVLDFETSFSTIPVRIINKSRCFNLNALYKQATGNTLEVNVKQKKGLVALLTELKIDPFLIEAFVDQLIDWVDTDDQNSPYGLEDYFYSGPQFQPKQYSSKRLWEDLEEVKVLPATASMDWELLEKYLCVIPNSKSNSTDLASHPININILKDDDIPLMMAIFDDFSATYAKSVMMNIPDQGYQSMNMLNEKNPNINFKSNSTGIFKTSLFEMKVLAPLDNKMLEISSLYYLKRNQANSGFRNLKLLNRTINIITEEQ